MIKTNRIKNSGINPFRFAFAIFLFLLLYIISITNLFRLQVYDYTFFTHLAQRQYNVIITQTPAREYIYDRKKQRLTLNKESFAAFITPNNIKNQKELKKFLKHYFPSSYARWQEHSQDLFMYIKRRLTDDEIFAIQNSGLSDIYILKEPSRFYTVPSLSHTIGFTDIDNKGISGIELICNEQLSGKPTTFSLEKDARSHNFYFKKNTTQKGCEGQAIEITIDADLQFLAYDELKKYIEKIEAKEGSVLIMDGTNGEILAMANYPDFDANEQLDEHEVWKTKNRIITECYEFGSVLKIFPALAALEEGVVEPEEIIDCENKKETFINGMKITTWKECGAMPYTDVIRYSNNIGTSKISLRLGKNLYDHLKKCGFMQPTGINFIGEQYGFITPPKSWSKATPLSLSFGYEISATLLQVARGFSLLSNKGILVTPKLFIVPAKPGTLTHTAKTLEPLYSEKTIATMRDIINFDHESSSAKYGRIPGYTIMGKTGSAYLISNGTYDKTRSIYTFVGIIEKGDYKRIIAVFIKEPKPTGKKVYAATVAVPLFKIIGQDMLVHEHII